MKQLLNALLYTSSILVNLSTGNSQKILEYIVIMNEIHEQNIQMCTHTFGLTKIQKLKITINNLSTKHFKGMVRHIRITLNFGHIIINF